MIRLKARIIILLFLTFFLSVQIAEAIPLRDEAFTVPEKIAGRVAFWRDIFAKYGKYTRVVHHRMYPQVVFTVLDFTDKASELGPVAIEKYIGTVEKETIDSISESLLYLADGGSPRNDFERTIEDKMSFIPGGDSKYKKAVDEDLIRTQTGIKERFEEAIRRSGRYLPLLERIFVEEYGLPVELTRLPFVESSFDYEALSSVGAAGLWQFMKSTGKQFGMIVNNVVDERRDPIVATRAAARYLKHAYDVLDSWPLALTSYNHGVAGVAKKMKEMGTNDLFSVIEHPDVRPLGFASNNFYPSFLAALEVYENYRLYFPDVQRYPPLQVTQRKLGSSVSAAQIARQVGISLEELKSANYALANSVWSGRAKIPAGYNLRIPVAGTTQLASLDLNQLDSQMEQEPAPPESVSSAVYGGATHKVRKGDTLLKIAKQYNVSVQELMQLNGLQGVTVQIGKILIVKERSLGKPTPIRSAPIKKSPPKPTKSPPARSYKVKSGDSLWSIAKKFNTSADAIQKRNGFKKGTTIKPGQNISIP